MLAIEQSDRSDQLTDCSPHPKGITGPRRLVRSACALGIEVASGWKMLVTERKDHSDQLIDTADQGLRPERSQGDISQATWSDHESVLVRSKGS